MTVFRPCIDLHQGQVKQIIGGSLADDAPEQLQTNYASPLPSEHYATLYRQHGCHGAHLIMLGPGNEDAARRALAAWPGGLQVGGGITARNAQHWIASGASKKVIATSAIFSDSKLSLDKLDEIRATVGRDRLVLDLSCRKTDDCQWTVAMNHWQTLTDVRISPDTLSSLAEHCSEFLVHAADKEGLCEGIDEDLVARLGAWSPIPVTYAGGAMRLEDLQRVEQLSHGKVDLTIGSALDIFGGGRVRFDDCVSWNTHRPSA